MVICAGVQHQIAVQRYAGASNYPKFILAISILVGLAIMISFSVRSVVQESILRVEKNITLEDHAIRHKTQVWQSSLTLSILYVAHTVFSSSNVQLAAIIWPVQFVSKTSAMSLFNNGHFHTHALVIHLISVYRLIAAAVIDFVYTW